MAHVFPEELFEKLQNLRILILKGKFIQRFVKIQINFCLAVFLIDRTAIKMTKLEIEGTNYNDIKVETFSSQK